MHLREKGLLAPISSQTLTEVDGSIGRTHMNLYKADHEAQRR
jgi:hypothetical protein